MIPLNPSLIAEGIKPPQIENPVDAMAGVLRVQQLRQQAAMAPLRMQQLQGEVQGQDTQNQIRQEQLRQQKEDVEADRTIQQTLADNGGDWTKARGQLSGKVPNRVLQKRDADHLEYTRALTAANADQRKHVIETSTMLGQELNGIINAPEDQRQAAWEGAKTRLEQEGVIKPGAYPDEAPPVETLKGYLAGTAYASTAAKAADAQAQEDQRRAMAKKTQEAAERADRLDRKSEFYQSLTSLGDDLDSTSYQQLRAALKPDIQSSFPRDLENPKTGRTREQTLEQIRRGSMSAKDLGAETIKIDAEGRSDRRLDIMQQRADAYDRKTDQAQKAQTVKPAQFKSVQLTKDNAIASSKRQLQKELAKIQSDAENDRQVDKKVDENVVQAAVESAWNDHIERLQDSQRAYEEQVGVLAGDEMPHNDWADKLKPPKIGKDGKPVADTPGAKAPVTTAPSAPIAAPAPTPQASAAPKLAPAAQSKVRTVTEGQISAAAERNGKTVDEVRAALKAQGINVVK